MRRAKFPSKCPECKGGIAPGDEIVPGPAGMIHKDCRGRRPPDKNQLKIDFEKPRKLQDLLPPKPPRKGQ